MNQLHIPMQRFGTTVRLAHGGGFDVRGCPDPEVLAFTIVRACNSHGQLVAAAKAALELISMEIADSEFTEQEIQLRAALAAAGVEL